MKEFYTISMIFDFKPKYFYLLVNFVDIVFNNFNMQNSVQEQSLSN